MKIGFPVTKNNFQLLDIKVNSKDRNLYVIAVRSSVAHTK